MQLGLLFRCHVHVLPRQSVQAVATIRGNWGVGSLGCIE